MAEFRHRGSVSARRRMLVFLHAFADGGAEAVFVGLANHLHHAGNEVLVVVGEATGANRRALHPDIRIVDLAAPRMMRAVAALARTIRTERPDACIAALTHANLALLIAARISRTPTRVIVSERRSLAAEFAESSPLKAPLKKALMRALYPRSDAIVAVSNALAAELSDFVPKAASRIRTIYNPVDAHALVLRAEAAAPCDAPVPAVPVIAFIGRLAPQKNVAMLLRAQHCLRQDRPAHLVLAGQGPLRDELAGLAARLSIADSVTFAGYLDNPYGLMSRADVIALPSDFEGLPNVLIEALAFGAQIVSTDCPTGPREILADGRYGRLVPVGDHEAFARALADALDAPQERDRAEALRPYAPDTVYAAYTRLLAPEGGA